MHEICVSLLLYKDATRASTRLHPTLQQSPPRHSSPCAEAAIPVTLALLAPRILPAAVIPAAPLSSPPDRAPPLSLIYHAAAAVGEQEPRVRPARRRAGAEERQGPHVWRHGRGDHGPARGCGCLLFAPSPLSRLVSQSPSPPGSPTTPIEDSRSSPTCSRFVASAQLNASLLFSSVQRTRAVRSNVPILVVPVTGSCRGHSPTRTSLGTRAPSGQGRAVDDGGARHRALGDADGGRHAQGPAALDQPLLQIQDDRATVPGAGAQEHQSRGERERRRGGPRCGVPRVHAPPPCMWTSPGAPGLACTSPSRRAGTPSSTSSTARACSGERRPRRTTASSLAPATASTCGTGPPGH
jgi:hypothetical protein